MTNQTLWYIPPMILVATKLLSRLKRVSVVIQTNKNKKQKSVVVIQKNSFVATNVFSRQAYLCRDKDVFVTTKIILVAAPASDTCRDKTFIATNTCFCTYTNKQKKNDL